ncbi:MAG: hypothetical protein JXK07_16755 [Spirochaetes bacterium]|nr:hypothetical protein [Spirochaetota bacterium]MBN2772135.1 hypothetical protein [Spirochaetota bacterium]
MAVFFGSFFFAIEKERTTPCFVKNKKPSVRERNETVQIIARENCAIILFHHFASLSLRDSGDRHGTFSGYSPETVQIIARENCAIIWTI